MGVREREGSERWRCLVQASGDEQGARCKVQH